MLQADVIPFSIAQTHCYAFRLCDCLVRHLPMVDMRLLDRCFRGNILVSVFGASSSHCGPNPLSFKISSICFILAIVYYKKLLLSYVLLLFRSVFVGELKTDACKYKIMCYVNDNCSFVFETS